MAPSQSSSAKLFEAGGNLLTGTDPEKILGAVSHWKKNDSSLENGFSQQTTNYFGNGHAAREILGAVTRFTGNA